MLIMCFFGEEKPAIFLVGFSVQTNPAPTNWIS